MDPIAADRIYFFPFVTFYCWKKQLLLRESSALVTRSKERNERIEKDKTYDDDATAPQKGKDLSKSS
jgi:hypothetical protein